MAAAYGADEGLGLGWIAIGLLGFAVGYLVPKVKPLTDAQTLKLGTWVPSIVAAVVAFRPDPAIDNGLIGIAGRAAIFGLVWLYFGVIFAFGLGLGSEKSKSNLPKPPQSAKHREAPQSHQPPDTTTHPSQSDQYNDSIRKKIAALDEQRIPLRTMLYSATSPRERKKAATKLIKIENRRAELIGKLRSD